MSGQSLIAAQGCIFSLPPCYIGDGREKLCHHQNCHHCPSADDFCAHGRATEGRDGRRAAGKQHIKGNAGVWVCPSEALQVGISFFHCFLLPIAFTTLLTRLTDSPDAETVWSNYAEHYGLKWAIYIGKCRLKILWFQHSSKYKPVIYCVYAAPHTIIMTKNSCT